MSTKIEISIIKGALTQCGVSEEKIRSVMNTLLAEAEAQGEDEKLPSIKKQWILLVSDPEGAMPKTDLVGWVLQIEESESPATTQDRINTAAYEYNTTRKGRLYPATQVGDALENVPTKYFKDAGLFVKSRTPVLVLRTTNVIPQVAKN